MGVTIWFLGVIDLLTKSPGPWKYMLNCNAKLSTRCSALHAKAINDAHKTLGVESGLSFTQG